MELSKQVLSLELAKEMKELGFRQNAYWTWYENSGKGKLMHNPEGYRGFEEKSFDAYTVAELGEMIPRYYGRQSFCCALGDGVYSQALILMGGSSEAYRFCGPTEADVRAKVLISLAKEGIINPKKI